MKISLLTIIFLISLSNVQEKSDMLIPELSSINTKTDIIEIVGKSDVYDLWKKWGQEDVYDSDSSKLTWNIDENISVTVSYEIETGIIKDACIENKDIINHSGISTNISNVSNSGCSLEISVTEKEDSLETGSYFWIEKEIDGSWEKLDYIIPEGTIGWESILYLSEYETPCSINIVWENIYGKLEAGSYRIGKNVTYIDNGTPRKIDNFYIYFTLDKQSAYDIFGEITNVTKNKNGAPTLITVEDKNSLSNKIFSLSIDNETIISGFETDDMDEGDIVRIWLKGGIKESYPLKGDIDKIEASQEYEEIPVLIYVIENNLSGFYPMKDFIYSDENIYQQVIEKFKENNVLDENVTCEIKNNSGNFTLYFNDDFLQQLKKYGSTMEKYTIACIVNTFIDSFNAKSVKLLVDGKDFETGHNVYNSIFENMIY